MKKQMMFEQIDPYVRYVHLFFPDARFSTQFRIPYDARCFLALNGEAEIETDKSTYTLHAREEILFIPAGVAYRFLRVEKGSTLLGINFDYTHEGAKNRFPVPPALQEEIDERLFTDDIEFLDVVEFNTPLLVWKAAHLIASAEEIEAIYTADHRFARMETSAKMKLFLLQIALAVTATESMSETANEVIAYIREHYASPISNQSIGQALNFHPNYLNRVIRHATGYSMHEYLLHCRLTNAMRLLQTTSLSVAEIAARSGFGDAQQFCKVFHRAVGYTPSAYRGLF